jgi:hypothetical protein
MGDIKASGFGGIPFGNTANRPAAEIGRLYSNGEEGRLELYTSIGWSNIVQEVPAVSSITGTYNESAGTGTITIYGTNFASGALVYATGTNGVDTNASSVTFNSVVSLTATFVGLSPVYEPYDIKVTNPSNLFGMLPDVLYINNTPAWNTAAGSIATFVTNTSISTSVSATDQEGTSIVYSSSNLPAWLSLNSSSGALTGTTPVVTQPTTYSFSITASDGVNTSARSFSVLVNDRSPVWNTGTDLPLYTRTVSYSSQLSATEPEGQTISYSIISGSLPTGLSLSSSGLISGTPAASSNSSFTVRASDINNNYADRTFTLNNVVPTWVTSGTITAFTRNVAYSFQLSATDDSGAAPTYSIASGSLPTGLSLSSSGLISGTPTSSLNTSLTFRATDFNGGYADSGTIVIPNVGPTWSTTSIPNGTGGIAYSQQVTAVDDSGNNPSYSLASGSLPSGLVISSSGLITGTPNQGGTASFTLRATDANGLFADRSFTITSSTGIVATGGTIVTSGGYKYHTFTGTGTFAVSAGATTNAFEILLVGGGGGGGNDIGGGGGAGGLIYKAAHTLSTGSYPVAIGGGSPRRPSGDTGNGASPSTFNSALTAFAGGGGSSWSNIDSTTGGSGGGGGGHTSPYRFGKASIQTSNNGGIGYGNSGGNGFNPSGSPVSPFGGGGGGGAGAPGVDGTVSQCGAGGAGTNAFSTWASATGTGQSGYYAGGGGSSSDYGVNVGAGGIGGGGRGLLSPEANSSVGDGLANTGGGGGGCDAYPGGAGGSGICIVRYLV